MLGWKAETPESENVFLGGGLALTGMLARCAGWLPSIGRGGRGVHMQACKLKQGRGAAIRCQGLLMGVAVLEVKYARSVVDVVVDKRCVCGLCV